MPLVTLSIYLDLELTAVQSRRLKTTEDWRKATTHDK